METKKTTLLTKSKNGKVKTQIKFNYINIEATLNEKILQSLQLEIPLGEYAILYNSKFLSAGGRVSRFDSKKQALEALYWTCHHSIWMRTEQPEDPAEPRNESPHLKEVTKEIKEMIKKGIFKIVKVKNKTIIV